MVDRLSVSTSDGLDNTGTMLQILSKQANGLKVCHLNAQSLYPKIDEFRHIFGGNLMDIICVSESWLKPHISDNLISLTNYTIFRNDRINKVGGGVVIFLRNNLHGRVVALSAGNAGIEYIFVEIYVGGNKCLIGTVYKPPQVTEFQFLEDELAHLCHSYEHIIISGDFNTNLLVSGGLTNSLRSLLDTFSLHTVNSSPTHFSDSSATLLDLFIVSNSDMVLFHNQVSASMFSKHDIIYMTYDLGEVDRSPLSFTYRDFKSVNHEQLLSDANELYWDYIFQLTDVDDQVEYFDNFITYLFDKHVPVRRKFSPISDVPWITSDILNLIEQRNRAYKLWKRFRIAEMWDRYRLLRNRVTGKIRMSKTRYYNSKLDVRLPAKRLWNNLASIGIGKRKKSTIDEDPNILNRQFTNNNISFSSHSDPFNSVCSGGFSFVNINSEDVATAIFSIKSKAVGLDNIYPDFVKCILPVVLPYITHIYNSILTSSVFPSKWKLAKVIPVRKSSRSNTPEYRPISILPFLSKALERILFNQMNEYLRRSNLLVEYQSGFRPKHSCTTALLKITDDIRCNISSNLVTVLALLDFSKAFDRVDHYILVNKLMRKFNFAKCAGKLIWSYLRGRMQRVLCNESMSSFLPTSSGVPQGSILGPLLFLCFINDLSDIISNCEYHIYADDVQLYLSRPLGLVEDLVARLNDDLAAISSWVQQSKLTLNASKSSALIIYKSDIDSSYFPPVEIDNVTIPYVKAVKNLGIIINSTLSWNNHINTTVAKIYGTLRRLSASANFTPRETRLYLVKTLIAPILTYCCEIFCNTDSVSYRKLQVAYNSAIRYVFGLRRRDHISPYSNVVFKCSLPTYFNYRLLCFLNNILITGTPRYLKDKVVLLQSTRNLSIMAPRFNNLTSERQFFVQAIRMWNALPLNIKRSSNSSRFKHILFSYLVDEH